ncbi:MAG: GHKL domain-containing protein [bacterium]|nr:GHKL domain-containing protein [bacterium]
MILFHHRAVGELRLHRDHQEELIADATAELRESNRKLNLEIEEHQKVSQALEQEFKARVEAERKQVTAVKQAERSGKLASIGVMAAGITHEINQPLNAIRVTADTVRYWCRRNPGKLPETINEQLDIHARSVDRIVEIIRHMRSFWVVADTPPVKSIDLNEAVANALSLTRQQLHAHYIQEVVRTGEQPLVVEGNMIHFEQVIVNLLVNAVHALDEIDKKNKKIELVTSTVGEGNSARLVISDNGPGLPDNPGDKIFDPFFSTRFGGEGMGLGLAIVKRYMDCYHGTIHAGNIQNNGNVKGARFTLEFPLREREESPGSQPRESGI